MTAWLIRVAISIRVLTSDRNMPIVNDVSKLEQSGIYIVITSSRIHKLLKGGDEESDDDENPKIPKMRIPKKRILRSRKHTGEQRLNKSNWNLFTALI